MIMMMKRGNELVFDNEPTYNWATVYEVSGVGEPIIYTRRKANNKRNQPSSGGIFIRSFQVSKKEEVQLWPQHMGRAKRQLESVN